MPNGWRTINSLVHKIRLHGRRGKGMAESFSRQKSRHAPQKEGGLKILCDLGQLNRGNEYFPVPARASEFGLARRVRPSCPTLKLNLMLAIHTIGSVPSLLGHAIAYRWRSLPKVRRHRTSMGLKVVLVTGATFAGHHGPTNVHLTFPNCCLVFLLRYAPCE